MSLRRADSASGLPRLAIVAAAVTMIVSAAILLTKLGSTRFGWYFDDLGELVAAGVAARCAATRARKLPPSALRRSWTFMALACASWTIGEGLWSWFELGMGKDPFPSIADIGYLGFPVAAAAALLTYPALGGLAAGRKRVLDSIMAITALSLFSWETVLGAVFRSPVDGTASFAVSLAYPVSDLVVLVLVILTLARARGNKLALGLMTAGCAALAVSDSLFAYLSATSGYTGGAVDLGWMAAFVLLALSATVPVSASEVHAPSVAPTQLKPSLMPYLPVVAALTVTLARSGAGHPPTVVELSMLSLVVVLMLARQYLTLRRNTTLAVALANREQQLVHQAFHDSLTGLANRALFQDRLGHAMALHTRDLRPLAVLLLDLDDFKLINDSRGHGAGDELLVRVAERLIGGVRHGDTVARLGGDEFAILLEDGSDPVSVADKISDLLRPPFIVEGQRCYVRASVGVFELAPGDLTTTPEELVARADTAMYAAKRSGKNRIALFQEGMSLTELADGQLAQDLADALNAGDLRLDYQPIIDLATGAVSTLEGLAHWRHDGQEVPPAVFIPLAERTGLIEQLTSLVLRLACSQLESWNATLGHSTVSVAVNVPPAQITADGFVTQIKALTEQYRLSHGQLILEITESGAFEDPVLARRAIADLRDLGIGISLDDFGVGQSSLAQLHNVDLDSIKIDKSFIDTLDSDPRQADFLRALLRLSADIRVAVIVEGVERPEQLAQILELGHPLAQGYLFARPMAPADCLPFLARGRSSPRAVAAALVPVQSARVGLTPGR